MQLQLEPERNCVLLTTLLEFYERVELPTTLQGLGMPDKEKEPTAWEIAKLTVKHSPHIHHFRREVSVQGLAPYQLTTRLAWHKVHTLARSHQCTVDFVAQVSGKTIVVVTVLD